MPCSGPHGAHRGLGRRQSMVECIWICIANGQPHPAKLLRGKLSAQRDIFEAPSNGQHRAPCWARRRVADGRQDAALPLSVGPWRAGVGWRVAGAAAAALGCAPAAACPLSGVAPPRPMQVQDCCGCSCPSSTPVNRACPSELGERVFTVNFASASV